MAHYLSDTSPSSTIKVIFFLMKMKTNFEKKMFKKQRTQLNDFKMKVELVIIST